MGLEERLADFRTTAAQLGSYCRRESEGSQQLWRTNHEVFAVELVSHWADFFRAGGELSVEGIQTLAKAAADFLAGQREASARAEADRAVQTRATQATARATWAAAAGGFMAAIAAFLAAVAAMRGR